ncbi:MAG TPA: acetyl-CoA carboxylase biotin carboxyl carrier protein [Planctomycetota bacterium]|nr:acetyl-CoA carboxylase biotin carboxyl carrier protein [Planctomycetota bacterium]
MDLSKFKDVKDLQALVDLMGRHELVEIELEGEGRKIRLRKAEAGGHREGLGGLPGAGYPMSAYPLPPGMGGPVGSNAAGAGQGLVGMGAAAPPAQDLREVRSPMVGTFYRSSSPEAEPFVKEGDSVEPDTVVCIIEAMKVMNEIPAGMAGIIKDILVKNGESVEFGQSLFRMKAE